jgi:hypothetical protein
MVEKNSKATGFYGDLNDSMQLALDEMKRWLVEIGVTGPEYDDYYMLRFLRARKFDLDKTKLMFNNFIQWRVE